MESFLIELIAEKAKKNGQWVRVEMASDDFYYGKSFEGMITDLGENHLILSTVKKTTEVCFFRSIKHIEPIESKPFPLMQVLPDAVEGYVKIAWIDGNPN